MQIPDQGLVDRIRDASRRIVRLLGFMDSTLAATQYPPSAVHAILEIGAHKYLTAVQLSQILGLEKSSISRLVRKLVEAGELKETPDSDDGRIKLLSLTTKGRQSLLAISHFGRNQVSSALKHLPEAEQVAVNEGLAIYAHALEASRHGQTTNVAEQVEIRCGYIPGVVGRVTEMHASYYSMQADFGQFFESQVATDVAEFAGRLHAPRNGLWAAIYKGRIVGSVAIDGEDLGGDIAHLRWYIVADGLRGMGVGQLLLQEALAFCEKHQFEKIHLWTFKGLDAARSIYERFGFSLAQEYQGEQWGVRITEQRFERLVAAR